LEEREALNKEQIDAMRALIEVYEAKIKRFEAIEWKNIYVCDTDVPKSVFIAGVEGLRTLVDEAADKAERADGGAVDEVDLEAITYVKNGLKQAAARAFEKGETFVYVENISYGLSGRIAAAAVRGIDALLSRVAQPAPAEQANGTRAVPFDRDTLGRFVREAWVRWANKQPNPKPTWLLSYDDLGESDKEADRQIGESVARWVLIGDAASFGAPTEPANPAEPTLEECVAAMNRANYCGLSDWMGAASSASETFWRDADQTKALGRWLIERERADAAKGGV
jgi:hypothetical protein